jgi:hypothetical protein
MDTTVKSTNRIERNGVYTPLPKLGRLEDVDVTCPFDGQLIISPIAAEAALPANIGNRRRRNNLVAFLCKQIKAGEWQSDHPQPLVWSSNGRFLDGQHRLFAIIEAAVEVIAHCVCGARDELREYIDTGISRKLEDRISFHEDLRKNGLCAQLVNTIFNLRRPGMGSGSGKPSPNEAWDIFTPRKDAIYWAVDVMTGKQRGVCRAPVILALLELYERDREIAQEFAIAMMQPDGALQQARVLRDFLLRQRAAGGSQMVNVELHGKAVCAMKAAMDDREIKTLRISEW